MKNKIKLSIVVVLIVLWWVFYNYINNQVIEDVAMEQKELWRMDIDMSEYHEDSLATLIQGKKDDSEMQDKFWGKKLSEEFCFTETLLKDSFNIKCIVPSKTEKQEFKMVKTVLKNDRNDSFKSISFEEKSFEYQSYDLIHLFDGSFLNIEQDLEEKFNSKNINDKELKALSYVTSLKWEYWKTNSVTKYNCENFEQQCYKDISLKITWQVINRTWRPLKSVKIELLNDTSILTETNEQGFYELNLKTFDLMKLRIKASKIGYSWSVIPLNIIGSNKERIYNNIDFILQSPVKTVTINNKLKTFTGAWVSIEDDSFIVTTSLSKYNIPFDSLVHKDKTKFFWEVEVYLFEFNKTDSLDWFLENDTFDEVLWYAWNLMKTFWMPYILFKTKEWETIHVLKSNPMVLQNQISEMNALKTNQDKIYEELTDEDLEYIVKKSEELWWYPIDRDFLTNPDYLLVRFPAFWMFDQIKWVWENVWMRLINVEWLSEMEFYTLSDL